MRSKKTTLTLFVLFLVCLMFSANSLQGATVSLNVNLVVQEHSQWCWAASSKCVLNFKGKTPTQCQIANYSWSRSDCCGNTNFNWSHACNNPQNMYGSQGSLSSILTYWGVPNTGSATYLSYTTCQSQINSNRVFVLRFGYSGGGGHFVVGYGYNTSNSTLAYMNPWPGEGLIWESYNYVKRNSSRSWTHTIKLN